MEYHFKKFPQDTFLKKIQYNLGPKLIGELDYVRIQKDRNRREIRHVYEIKSSNRLKDENKAKRQLNKYKNGIGRNPIHKFQLRLYLARPTGPFIYVDKFKGKELINLEKILLL